MAKVTETATRARGACLQLRQYCIASDLVWCEPPSGCGVLRGRDIGDSVVVR